MPNEISCPECGEPVLYEPADLKTATSSKPARCPKGHDLWLVAQTDGCVNAHKAPTQ